MLFPDKMLHFIREASCKSTPPVLRLKRKTRLKMQVGFRQARRRTQAYLAPVKDDNAASRNPAPRIMPFLCVTDYQYESPAIRDRYYHRKRVLPCRPHLKTERLPCA